MDLNLQVERVVPAGGSIDVPIAFEGTSGAKVGVGATTIGVTASLAGTDLSGGTVSGHTVLQTALLSNPADATLHVVNPGSTESTVTIITTIITTRHLTITPANRNVSLGGAVSFTVSVNEPLAGEVATAYLVDPSGTKTPVTLTPAGDGTWTGQAVATASGRVNIQAQTTGNRPRYAEAGISVASGKVTVAPGITEQLVDTDHDGLANWLRLTITVTATEPGKYVLVADLLDPSGQEIDNGGGEITLVAGTQQVPIDFSGKVIYRAGVSGPYHAVNLSISNTVDSTTEASAADLGTTQAYDYKVFQH